MGKLFQTDGKQEWLAVSQARTQELIDVGYAAEIRGNLPLSVTSWLEGGRLPDDIKTFMHKILTEEGEGFGSYLKYLGSEIISKLNSVISPTLAERARQDILAQLHPSLLSPSDYQWQYYLGSISATDFDAKLSRMGYDRADIDFLQSHTVFDPDIQSRLKYSIRRDGFPPTYIKAYIREEFWNKWGDIYSEIVREYPTLESKVFNMRQKGVSDSDMLRAVSRYGYHIDDCPIAVESVSQRPDLATVARHFVHGFMPEQNVLNQLHRFGALAGTEEMFFNAAMGYPAPYDIVRVGFLKSKPEASIATDLYQIGIHPEHVSTVIEAARYYPTVQDLVTMAVREVFTPAIVTAYGLMEDFPQEFADWSKKFGMKEEFAKMYWGMHWRLPSIQDGYDMLHRGIITEAELETLLRTSDYMPFWRKKLMDVSHKVISRIDIRRMYQLDVIDETAVKAAYIKLGYKEDDANNLTKFVVKQAAISEIEYTKAEVLKGYETGMLDKDELTKMLDKLGIHPEDIDFEISRVDFIIAEKHKKRKIEVIHDAYMRWLIDDQKASAELDSVETPAPERNLLLTEWEIERTAKQKVFTPAQIVEHLATGSLSKAQAEIYLKRQGYDSEHVNIILADASIAASQSSSNKPKLDRTVLTLLFNKKIITSEQVTNELILGGWRTPELEWLTKLITAEGT